MTPNLGKRTEKKEETLESPTGEESHVPPNKWLGTPPPVEKGKKEKKPNIVRRNRRKRPRKNNTRGPRRRKRH